MTPSTEPVDLRAAAAALEETWSPRVVARVNDQLVKVVRVEGEFVWHDHATEDELFLVLEGQLLIDFEDRPTAVLDPGGACVVPRGLRHRPRAPDGCLMALLEPASTAHTGEEVTAITRSLADQMGTRP